MPTETRTGKTILRLLMGDIAERVTDAVVTAAYYRLNKGTGTDENDRSHPAFVTALEQILTEQIGGVGA